MKKIITILSIVLIVFGICGCSQSAAGKYGLYDVFVELSGYEEISSKVYEESEYDDIETYYYSDGDLEGTTKTVSVLGKEYYGEYFKTMYHSGNVFESDVYVCYDEKGEIITDFHVERKTGKVLQLLDGTAKKSNEKTVYDIEKCQEIADGILSELVDDLDAYSLRSTNEASYYQKKTYNFMYGRKIDDAWVKDTVQVSVFESGELYRFMMSGYRNFDDVKRLPESYDMEKINSIINNKVSEICKPYETEYDIHYEKNLCVLIKMDDGSLGMVVTGYFRWQPKNEKAVDENQHNEAFARFIICLGDYEKKLSLHMFK